MNQQRDNIYRRLAEHLDRLPDGFPPSETGAHLRVLERLFTPEEADLAVHLTLDQETVQVIAARAGLPLDQVEPRLEGMAQKGLVLSYPKQDGSFCYQGLPWVIGIYELQVKDLSHELMQDLFAYWSTVKERPKAQTIPQMRTIPVGESIERHLEALPYEQVNELVKSHHQFAVAPCLCRRGAKLAGAGCHAPEESCLVFGDWAGYYVRTGRGRSISQAEVIDILAKADAANLVLQPTNSRQINFICCCCGCCCGVLAGLKKHPRPADVVASSFMARLDEELCESCWTCIDRCQMDALVAGVGHVTFKSERCIGCGLCVTTCPSGALTLERKPESAQAVVPATMDATWHIILQDQAKMHP